jgi:hypothetical protein
VGDGIRRAIKEGLATRDDIYVSLKTQIVLEGISESWANPP